MHSQSLSGGWNLRKVGEAQVYPAQVPGGVHTDLLAAGCIPDPFVGDKELDVQWVAQSDWEYTRTFHVPSALLAEEIVYLVCDGLDTLGKVQLNGKELGRFENMFRQYRWEVKDLLHNGENSIIFTFDSPVNYASKKEAEFPLTGVQTWSIMGGPYLRKAPCHFGWDWGPMLPAIGIWKDLHLEGYSTARIADVHLRQRVADGKAYLSAKVSVEQWRGTPLQTVIKLTAPSGKTYQQTAVVDGESVTVQVEVVDPQLWWPNGYGDQPL